MGVETRLGADIAGCVTTIGDLEWMAGTLDDTARTTQRVVDGSGAWCHAYENTVADLGRRATDQAADVRGVAASLGVLVERLGEVDAVLARARSAASARSLLSGTVVVEPDLSAGAEAWSDYGTIVGTVAEARRRQGAAESAWVDALERFGAGGDPAPPPVVPTPLVVAPDRWPPPVGDLPGEHAAPRRVQPDPSSMPEPKPEPEARPPRPSTPSTPSSTTPGPRHDAPGSPTPRPPQEQLLGGCAPYRDEVTTVETVTRASSWVSAPRPGPGSWIDLLEIATASGTPPDDA